MVALPNPTIDAIYQHYENKPEARRVYLGGSRIGEECRRLLWLEFRWVGRVSFPGRILRLFETGHREEDRIIENLRAIGCTVDGAQFEIVDCNGHFRGHIDGGVLGLLEAPETWHLLECKTANKKQFDKIEKEGCEKAKPIHYAQCQVYMHKTKMDRAVYIVQCKDDDRLYLERIKYDRPMAEALIRKASSIINADEPPERIGKDCSYYACKFCPMMAYCWDRVWPDVNCRTCAYSRPINDGKWECAAGHEMTPTCENHIYLPSLIHWTEPVDGGDGWIEYPDFINVGAEAFPARDKPHYTSRELHAQAISK